MNISEIINEIHNNHIEIEVYDILHDWLLSDVKTLDRKLIEKKAIIRAVEKIAANTTNAKNALEGIINLCNE